MVANPLALELENLHHKWGWLLLLGISMVFLGTVAFFLMGAATIGTVLVLGWLLVISGIFEAIQAFRSRGGGHLFLHLVGGILGILVGLLVATHPIAGAMAWTLLFASFFTVIGVFRIITAISLKFPNWGWAVFDGVVSLGLGILLWLQWPISSFWFMGLAVGISLLLRGWTYIMLAFAFRSLKTVPIQIRRAA